MADAAPITRDTLRGCTGTFVMQMKLGRGGAMYEWACAEHPRLHKHSYRGTRDATPVVSWTVDGHRCTDLDEAIRLLNGPVIAEDLFEAAGA